MKKIFLALVIGSGLLAGALSAFAHEQQSFTIGGKNYLFVVGTLGEPVAVDDKAGVDLTVTQVPRPGAPLMSMSADGDMDTPAGTPVTGLDQTLKVELIAGSQKRTLDLSPQYGADGKYKAVFIPTIQTTYSYRFFGTINNTPVDLTFTCVPSTAAKAPEDTSAEKISDGVSRTFQTGAFGCPLAKSDLGFPEAAPSLADLSAQASAGSGSVKAFAIVGFALSVAALAAAYRKPKAS